MTNKLKTVSRYFATVLLCSCLILGTFVNSATAITRSCNAEWVLENPATGGKISLEKFSAKGTCGRTVPNRCRIRANEAAHRCMQVHWDTRWDRKKPDTCEDGFKVFNYDVVDLKERIEKKACDAGWKGKTVKLYAKTTGDKKCPKTRPITTTYKITNDMCES